MAFILAIIQGSSMGHMLHSSHCISPFVLLHHCSFYFFVHLDPLYDYTFVAQPFSRHLYPKTGISLAFNPMKILLIASQVNFSFNSQLLFKEVTILGIH